MGTKNKNPIAIPVNNRNIHTVAAQANISANDLYDKMAESKITYKKQCEKEWAISYLSKDEKWFDEAEKKIEQIRKSLPEGMDEKEKIIKLYGWIADTVEQGLLRMPLTDNTEYSRADSVSLIMTNPDLFNKICRWD
mgnify:CR=1 FL=1